MDLLDYHLSTLLINNGTKPLVDYFNYLTSRTEGISIIVLYTHPTARHNKHLIQSTQTKQ